MAVPRSVAQHSSRGTIRISVRPERGQDRTGRWDWRARIMTDDGYRTIWTGRRHRSEVERDVAQDLAGRIDELLAPVTSDDGVVVVDLGGVLDAWLAFHNEEHEAGRISDRTHANVAHIVKAMQGTIGRVPLDDCADALREHAAIRRRTPHQKGDGYAWSTIKNECVEMRSAWAFVVSRGAATGSGPEFPDGERVYNDHTITADECRRILEAMANQVRFKPWHPVAVRALWYSGARIGAIAKLRRCDVIEREVVVDGALVRRWFARLKSKPRGKDTYDRPIPAELAHDMLALRPDEPPEAGVWPTAVSSLKSSAFCNVLVRACRLAGVPRVTAHGFRRAQDDALVDPKVWADLQDHSELTAMTKYRKSTEARLVTAAEASWTRVELGEVVELEGRRPRG